MGSWVWEPDGIQLLLRLFSSGPGCCRRTEFTQLWKQRGDFVFLVLASASALISEAIFSHQRLLQKLQSEKITALSCTDVGSMLFSVMWPTGPRSTPDDTCDNSARFRVSLQVRDVAAPRGTAGSHGRGFYCERAEHRKPLSAQKERSLVWTVTKQITPSLKAAEAKSPEAEKTVGRLKE